MRNKAGRYFLGQVALLSVFVLAYFLYLSGLPGPMLLDDQVNLIQARLYSLDETSLKHVFFHNDSGLLGRGVSALTLGLTHFFHGEDTFYYKYHNFLIHCLLGLALFYLSFRLLLLTQYAKKAVLISGFTAFIWLIHPIHVSTVLYIVQRMAQLSALFTVCALICYVVGRVRIEQGHRFGVTIILIGYPTLLLFGLLSKENAALCTLFTLLIEVFFFSSLGTAKTVDIVSNRADEYRYRRWFVRIIFIAIPIVLGMLAVIYKLDSFLSGYNSRPFSLQERLLTQVEVVFYYLKLILVPQLSEYSLYHDDIPVVRYFSLGTFIRIFSILAVVALSIWSVFKGKINLILFGVCWFFIAHIMESTIIPLEMVFEHRNYLASYGVLVAVSAFSFIYLERYAGTLKFSYGAALVFCVLLIFVLSIRVDSWSSEEQLTLVNVTDHPESARAHTARANVLAKHGFGEQALFHLTKAYELQSWNPGALIHRNLAACVFHKLTPEMISQSEYAFNNAYLTSYTWLAFDSLITNIEAKHCELDQQDLFRQLNAIDLARGGLVNGSQAKKAFFIARYYQFIGEEKLAIEYYNKAIELTPNLARYRLYKIDSLIRMGLLIEARADIELLLEENDKVMGNETLNIQILIAKLIDAERQRHKDLQRN